MKQFPILYGIIGGLWGCIAGYCAAGCAMLIYLVGVGVSGTGQLGGGQALLTAMCLAAFLPCPIYGIRGGVSVGQAVAQEWSERPHWRKFLEAYAMLAVSLCIVAILLISASPSLLARDS